MEPVKPPRRTLRRRTFLESNISQTAEVELSLIQRKREKSGEIADTPAKPHEPDLELPLEKAHENCDSRIDIQPEPKQTRAEATPLYAAPCRRFTTMSVKPTKGQSVPSTSKDVPVPNSEQRSPTAVISDPDHVIQPTTSPVGFTFPITIPSGDKHVGATGPIFHKRTPHLFPNHGMPSVRRSEPDKIDATSSSLRVMKPNPAKKKRLVVVSRMYEEKLPKENNPARHKDHNPPSHAESNPIFKTASIQDQSESSELVASVPKTPLVKDKPKSDVATTCNKVKTGEQSTSPSSASSKTVVNLWKAEAEERGNSLENTSCIDKPQHTPENTEEAGPPVCADTKNGASQNTRDSPQSLNSSSVDTHQDIHHGTESVTSIDSEDDEDEHDPMNMQNNISRSNSSDTEIIDERNRETESFYKILELSELSSIRLKPGPKSKTRYQEIPNFNKPLWQVALEESRKERQMAAAEEASSSSDDSSSDSSDSDSADDDLNDPSDFSPNDKANDDGAPLKSNPQKPLPYPQQFDFIPNRAEDDDDANLIEDEDHLDPMALDKMAVTRDNGRKGVEPNSTLQSSDSEAAPSVDETVQVSPQNAMGDFSGASGRILDKVTSNTQESQPASSHGDSDSDIEIIEELPCPRKSDRQSIPNQSKRQERKRNSFGQSSIKRQRLGSNDDK